MDEELKAAIAEVCDNEAKRIYMEELMIRSEVYTIDGFLQTTEKEGYDELRNSSDEILDVLRRLLQYCYRRRKQEQGMKQDEIDAGIAQLILEKLYELNRAGKVPPERREEYESHVECLKLFLEPNDRLL